MIYRTLKRMDRDKGLTDSSLAKANDTSQRHLLPSAPTDLDAWAFLKLSMPSH